MPSMPVVITASSTASLGASTSVVCDWVVDNPVSVMVTMGSSQGSVTFTVQATLDDLMTSSARFNITPSFSDVSSAIALSSGGVIVSSIVNIANPIAAVRINTTAQSSTSVLMHVLQGIGA